LNNQNFKKLYSDYQGFVKYIVNKFTSNKDDAKDLHSQVWEKAFIAKDKYSQDKSFSKWISTVTHNTCVDFLRGKKPVYTLDEIDEFGYFASDNSLESERSEKYRILKEALSKLLDEEKSIIILFYFEDMSIKSISNKFGLSKGTVKVRLHRSREKLRNILEDSGYFNK